MSCGFINAQSARELAQPTAMLYQEVCDIQQAILTAASQNKFDASLAAFANTADPTVYADVVLGLSDDPVVLDSIQFVIDYFTGLDYNIRTVIDTSTGDTLRWNILW